MPWGDVRMKALLGKSRRKSNKTQATVTRLEDWASSLKQRGQPLWRTTMRVEPAKAPAFGIDTVQTITPEACRWLVLNGYHFVVRYLGGLTREELDRILCAGLAVMPVTYSRGAGWTPSGPLGEEDGDLAVDRLEALGMPQGATVWLDLEECAGPAVQTTAWVNAWSLVVKSAGYEPGLYVGANPGGLDSDALWKLPFTTRYWRSCSRVPEPSNRGWCMQQLKPWNIKLELKPWNIKLGPLIVDVDVIEQDFKGDVPSWVVA